MTLNMDNMKIEIKKEFSFRETYYVGEIIYEEIKYPFWFIENTEEGEDTQYRIEWFYKKVPMVIRRMDDDIVPHFKNR